MKHWPYIAIIVLLIFIHFKDEQNDKLREKLLEQQYDELTFKLDSTDATLRRSLLVRSVLDSRLDSVLRASQALELEFEKVNKKLKAIPGRYKDIKVDSLALIMNRRADARK